MCFLSTLLGIGGQVLKKKPGCAGGLALVTELVQ